MPAGPLSDEQREFNYERLMAADKLTRKFVDEFIDQADSMLVIQASSGGFDGDDFAEITINNVKVVLEKNEHGHFRGLHVVVVNGSSGKIEFAKVFDTYKTSSAFDEFTDNPIPEGYIVIAACQDECTASLSEKGRQWFRNMGSKSITEL